MDQIDEGRLTERASGREALRSLREEVPDEEDAKVVVRIVRVVPVEVRALGIALPGVHEVAVRARIAHSRLRHRRSRFTALRPIASFP
mgnify:CR=1 FL=1